MLNGKPLIQYSIEAARACSLITKIVVSTDSSQIAEKSKELGAEVIMRPEELSGDKALVIHAIRHVIAECEKDQYFPEIILLLECTSPVKRGEDINLAIQKLINKEADTVATFKESPISPNRLWKIEKGSVSPYLKDASPFLPRQSQPTAYELTGQIYAFTNEIFKSNPHSISILMGRIFPIVSSLSIDIDVELDLIIAEQILKYLENEKT